MAFVLSNQENIDLLLLLVKIAISIGAIAIFLLLWFWLRLKKLEKRLYLNRRQHHRQLRARVSANTPSKKIRPIVEPIPHRLPTPTRNLSVSRPPVSATQVYRPKTLVTVVKKSHRSDNLHLRSHWILAILLAIITGMAIAIMQLGNSLISPELMPFVWFFIGFMLIVSATFAKSA
jgi:hypothetical protein